MSYFHAWSLQQDVFYKESEYVSSAHPPVQLLHSNVLKPWVLIRTVQDRLSQACGNILTARYTQGTAEVITSCGRYHIHPLSGCKRLFFITFTYAPLRIQHGWLASYSFSHVYCHGGVRGQGHSILMSLTVCKAWQKWWQPNKMMYTFYPIV